MQSEQRTSTVDWSSASYERLLAAANAASETIYRTPGPCLEVLAEARAIGAELLERDGPDCEPLSDRDRAYEAYDPHEDGPSLVREVDGWSVYSRRGARLARYVGVGSKRRAIARMRWASRAPEAR